MAAKDKPDAIIKRVQAYGPYPIEKISVDAVKALDTAASRLPDVHQRSYLSLRKLLECYLCITQQTIECLDSGVLRIGVLYEELIGAIYSSHFFHCSLTNRYSIVRAWNALILEVDAVGVAEVRMLHWPLSNQVTEEINSLVEAFGKRKFDTDEVFFWRDSQIQRRNGGLVWVPLRRIGIRYGRDFAKYVHTACHTHVFVQNSRIIEVNFFLNFLADLSETFTTNSFCEPKVMEVVWKKFKREFVEINLGPSTYRVLTANWQQFLNFALRHLNGKGPFGKADSSLISLPNMDDEGHGPNITVGPDGKLVAQKLLIDIPLEVSEEAVLRILFDGLSDRVTKISLWARNSADAIWKRYLRRVEAARYGDADRARIRDGGQLTDVQFAHIAAKFEKTGFIPTLAKASILAKPLGNVAFDLGLPLTGALLPHMALLVIADPQLTPSFFDSCELYDKHGQINGLIQTDSGALLQGYKLRRGPDLAQQIIHLTPEAEELVKQIIVLTTPLREFLKKQNDDNWRKLFLTCGTGFGYPKGIKSTGLTADVHRVKELKTDFVAMNLVSEADVSQFVSRFSLSSLRATTAVISYIENPDVGAFVKKLGHAKFTPTLMARYMPAPLLAFFQQRWVRLFQCAIIATAMEGSPYRLQATGFEKIEQMHEFLKNHALKLRPRPVIVSTGDDKYPSSETGSSEGHGKWAIDEVVFSVSVENLTVLLSLMAAVNASQRPISPFAKYWSTYGERLISHIEKSDENSIDLHDFLAQAKAKAKANATASLRNIEQLIYA